MLAIGARGDVQPMIALGAGLRAAGLDVVFATHADFAEPARARGLDTLVILGDSATFFGGAAGVAMRDYATEPRRLRRFVDAYLPVAYEKLLQAATAACEGADAVVCWPFGRGATSLAEALRVPVFVACPYPPAHLPTQEFPNPYVQATATDAAGIRRGWRLSLPLFQMNDPVITRWRRQTLGLPPLGWREDLRRLRRLPHLLGFSTTVLPRPHDWAPWVDVTGFWFDDTPAQYEPPRELRAFLDAGPPPVAIGFSSHTARDGDRLGRAVSDGVAQAGLRAVLLGGYGALARVAPAPHLCAVPSVPHAWLFPRTAAVVHHGGSGSTAEALRAGVPNMAVPFGYDQPLWGARLAALGVGPDPIPAAALTADALATALRQLVSDETMRARAADAGRRIRSEDGVGHAVATVMATLQAAPAGVAVR
jgi:UDP:flavonoid glycosyltransferase YjiC (YdhE family)